MLHLRVDLTAVCELTCCPACLLFQALSNTLWGLSKLDIKVREHAASAAAHAAHAS